MTSDAKGLRRIKVAMDIDREMKFPLPAVARFESACRKYLVENKIVKEGAPVIGWTVLTRGLAADAEVFLLALEACLDLNRDELLQALGKYKGDRATLGRLVVLALAQAEDPSQVSSLERSWKNSDAIQKLEDERSLRLEEEKIAEMEAEAKTAASLSKQRAKLKDLMQEAELAKIEKDMRSAQAQIEKLRHPPAAETEGADQTAETVLEDPAASTTT
jgi:hypothetical protein